MCLEMMLTRLRVLPYQSDLAGLAKIDTLRKYYLDWSNFSETDNDDVQALIDNFWLQIQGLLVKTAIQTAKVAKAYETLLLPLDTDFKQVKGQYGKLLHPTHPDKGGDKAQTQKIEHSYRILKSVNR